MDGRATAAWATESWSDILSAPVAWPVGGYLFRQDEVPQNVYILEDGFAKIVVVQDDGRESIVELKGPGSFLGLAGLGSVSPNRVSAVTASPCRLRWSSLRTFREALRTDPQRLAMVMQVVVQDVEDLTDRVISLSIRSSKTRLLRELRQWKGSAGGGGKLRPPLKQTDLAALIAVTPEHLNRLLKDMSSRGVISRNRGRVSASAERASLPEPRFS